MKYKHIGRYYLKRDKYEIYFGLVKIMSFKLVTKTNLVEKIVKCLNSGQSRNMLSLTIEGAVGFYILTYLGVSFELDYFNPDFTYIVKFDINV